jgi:hypothetical protein
VFGIGSVLRALIVDGGSEIEPIPDRRITWSRVRTPWSGYQRRALLTLADRATDEIPLRRPPARRLASDILDTVPTARLGEDADPFAALRSSADEIEPSRRARWVSLVAIGAGVVLVLLGITGLRDERSVAEVGVATTTPTLPAVQVEPDGVITIGTQRFSVGLPDDRVAVGDWNCDGVMTPALLRPATGAVFVFDGWATEGADVSVSPTRIIAGAVDVVARDNGNGCSTLIVVRDDGTEQEII